MADIICRWRNGTPQTVVELVNALPHNKMPIDEFRSTMEKCWEGFFRTAYQLACQLALYCESEDGYYYPRFDRNITESEAKDWLLNWLPKYYIPNPYTKKDGFNDIECPTYVLKALYDYVKEHGTCSYATAFKNVFHEDTRNNDDIIKNYINNYSRVLSFSKYGNLEIVGSYEETFGNMDRNDKKGFFDSFDKKQEKEMPKASPFSPTQIIYYGVPGCGKSHTVDAEINKSISEYNKGRDESDKISYEKQVIRVVFHPDYGNSDFIGQIMPKLRERGGVDYVFKPGPLAQILRMAYLNSDKPYFLVVEEINRGNAAAIFGETFQLLDRIKDGKKDKNGYGPGWSSYSILNDDVNDYIRDIKAYEKFEHSGSIKANHPKDMINGDGNPVDAPDANGHKEIDFSTATSYCSLELILQGFDCPQTFRESTAIRLPPNLSIYATMNTSDQNVFTLDNAFQRRWEMKQIPNELKNTGDAAEVAQYNQVIKNGVSWGDFRKLINKIIEESAQANGLSSMEDKRLGGWFFTPPDNFAEKVLKYLWDDAFKFDRPNQFTGFKTLEELVTNFNTAGFKVFKDDRISKLQKDSSITPNGSAQNDTPVVDG